MLLRKIKEEKEVIGLAVILAVGAYLYFGLVLKTQFAALRSTQTRFNRLKNEFARYKNDFANFKKLSSEAENLKIRAQELEAMLISDSQLPEFLDQISQKANAQGIKIIQLTPVRTALEEEKALKAFGDINVNEVPVKLELLSGYHQLGRFMSVLEENPFLGVVNIVIKGTKDPLRHIVNLNLRAYVVKK